METVMGEFHIQASIPESYE